MDREFLLTKIMLGKGTCRDPANIKKLFDPVTAMLSSKCPLQLNDVQPYGKTIVIRAYCDFKRCRSYKLKIATVTDGAQLPAMVTCSANAIDHQSGAFRGGKRNLAGQERVDAVKKATAMLPRQLMTADRLRSDPALVAQGNMDHAATDAVYKAIRSVAQRQGDDDRDQLMSLVLHGKKLAAADKDANYVHLVALHPMMAILISNQQAMAAYRISKSPKRQLEAVVAGIDSTGKLSGTFPNEDHSQRIQSHFYRLATSVTTVNRGQKEILPLMEAFVLREDTTTIKLILNELVKKVTLAASLRQSSLSRSLFDLITTDKALSTLHAISSSLNNIPLHMTYNFIYKAIMLFEEGRCVEAEKMVEQLVIPCLCFVHGMKNATHQIKGNFPDVVKGTSEYRFLKRVFKLMVSSTKLRHLLHEVWANLVVLLLSPTVNAVTLEAKNRLKVLINITRTFEEKHNRLPIWNTQHLPPLPLNINPDSLNVMTSGKFYEKTATYWAFKDVSDNASMLIKTSPQEATNVFYSPGFHRYLLVNQAPFIISSSQVYHEVKFYSRPKITPQRRNNQPIEQSFGDSKRKVKQSINHHLNGRIDRNVKLLREDVEATLAFVDIGDVHQKVTATSVRSAKSSPTATTTPTPSNARSALSKRTRLTTPVPKASQVKPLMTSTPVTTARGIKRRHSGLSTPASKKTNRSEMAEEEIQLSQTPIIQSEWRHQDPDDQFGYLKATQAAKSIVSPHSKSLEKQLVLTDSGIVLNPDWYQRSFAGRLYRPVTCCNRVLTGKDLCRLRDFGRYIGDDVVMVAIQSMASQYDGVEVMEVFVAQTIFFNAAKDMVQQLDAWHYHLPYTGLLLMVVTGGGHHWLCVANFTTSEFTCVDSLLSDSTEDQKIQEQFLRFTIAMSRTNRSTIGWKLFKSPHLMQDDGHECGAFVYKHAQQIIIDGVTSDGFFDGHTVRLEMLHTILVNSQGSDQCIVCSALVNGPSLELCNLCQRQWHISCLPSGFKTVMVGICELCFMFSSAN